MSRRADRDLQLDILAFGDDASHDILVGDAKRLQCCYTDVTSRAGFYRGRSSCGSMQRRSWSSTICWVWLPFTRARCSASSVCGLQRSRSWRGYYRDLVNSLAASLFAVAASLSVLLCWDPSTLIFTFFPVVTVSSSILFFASGAALVAGRFEWIWAFVLSALALLHEHASFVALVPLMGAGFLAAAILSNTVLHSARGILKTWRSLRASVVASGLIALIFLLPIVLQTLVAYPGELPKYFAFASQAKFNSWAQVAQAILDHWYFAGPAVLSFFWLRRPSRTPMIRAMLAVLIIGSAATAYYARCGVDDLVKFAYTISWYQAVPSVCTGLAAATFAQRNASRWLVVPAALMILVLARAHWMPPRGSEAAARSLALTLDFLRNEGRSRGAPLRLKVDSRGELPSRAWEFVLSILSGQERTHERLVCIDADSWTIAYHDRNRCEPRSHPESACTSRRWAASRLRPFGCRLALPAFISTCSIRSNQGPRLE